MERWVAKLLALLVIFSLTLASTLLPICVHAAVIRQGQRGRTIISCLMCFGGGVFLSVYMLHMAPDVVDIMTRALLMPYGIDYPVSEFIMVIGFFLMVFCEYCVHSAREKKHHTSTTDVQAGDKSDESNIPLKPTTDVDEQNSNITGKKVEKNNGAISEDEPTTDTDSNSITINTDEEQHNHAHNHIYNLQSTRSILLLLALSLHHMFEGISVGLKHSVVAVWSLCIAIISHEIIVGFSLGLQLVKTYKQTKRVVIYGVFCSAMVPVGLAIGMLIMETGGDSSESPALLIVNGVLQALSTGVFIYITFFEILQGEMSDSNPRLSKIVCMFAGFLVMALLGLIPEKSLPANPTNCTCT